ncbi:hypothetical protein JTE90_029266 [Oedothorax gibbosus]|uniref:Uncharacterized protein n=1 Tax=Oedothorax gibbosus TaxID=931172 RepID=A0AAV6TUJ7_9ARAC|nr:hypothetical protein JTE90_029266 [Oedothorax gibbosus]
MSTDSAEFRKEKLVFNLKDIWEMEQMTILQSESSLWKEQFTHMTSHIPAIAYGNKYESLVKTQIRSVYPNSLVRTLLCLSWQHHPMV